MLQFFDKFMFYHIAQLNKHADEISLDDKATLKQTTFLYWMELEEYLFKYSGNLTETDFGTWRGIALFHDIWTKRRRSTYSNCWLR